MKKTLGIKKIPSVFLLFHDRSLDEKKESGQQLLVCNVT